MTTELLYRLSGDDISITGSQTKYKLSISEKSASVDELWFAATKTAEQQFLMDEVDDGINRHLGCSASILQSTR